MNPIRTIRRLATTLTGLAAALAAAVAARPPPSPSRVRRQARPPRSSDSGPRRTPSRRHRRHDGWQITLIAVGAAILGAIVAVLVDRARAARGHRPATAA